ncbi:hypothetical protein Psch_02432 [Pelotomaculum schinkii]|uniref:SiaC family regulatory phosphoprotein domain-containing protein n=1 Tax=Pelotomaculum schinkii TaxID=78350 RepID=A0A4Y7R9R2_9FIRM|nr:DUF1987 domain-containing protein [Pelotomaculum schinkii]TEB05391.1 hypothetical protein Psch_02432 [Pelotomaculum schinkii]
MVGINIEATKSTPEIKFAGNTLTIKGQSYPENSVGFYAPVFAWVDEYLEELDEGKAIFEFNLIYINTSSSKCMMDFIDKLQEAFSRGKQVMIKWYCDPDNESLLECAEEFKEDVEFPFEIILV